MDPIHLINPMTSFSGGSEWRIYELYRLLSPHREVKVWATEAPDPRWETLLPIRRLTPKLLRTPLRGTFVFVGIYFKYFACRPWVRPRRLVVLYNTHNPSELKARLRQLASWRRAPSEIVYASPWMREEIGLEGAVQSSPIDLERFSPTPAKRPSAFTLGRLSRDVDYKHHPGDLALYTRLARQGVKVRIMGGTCLATQGEPPPGVELLPVETQEASDFLRGLDCFFFRTDASWKEPHCRAIQEAMACGLPVVCEARGGQADYIQHGINGFLFENETEAEAQVTRLQGDPELRRTIGAQARRSMEDFFSVGAMQRVKDYYIN